MPGLSRGRERSQAGLVDDDESRFEPTDARALRKKYPSVKTELFRAGRGPCSNKVLAEALASRHAWDVLSGSGEMYAPLMERKLVVPYRSPKTKPMMDR